MRRIRRRSSTRGRRSTRRARTAIRCSGFRTPWHRLADGSACDLDRRHLMKTGIILAVLAAGVCASQPALAHHPFAAEYDVNKPVTLTGTLARMEWVNPHGWIYIDVKQPDGTIKQWTVETSGPGQMSRRGLKKTDTVDGMSLVIKGYQSRKNPTLANGRTLVLADGRSFYIGAVGGPSDGADR